MNKELLRDQMLKKHYDRWIRLGRLQAGTNEKMAETALKDLYRLYKHPKPPRQIVWLNSPLQMASVPLMVSNIVQGDTWKRIHERMSSLQVGTEEWDREWKRHWQTLFHGEVHDLLPAVLRRPDFIDVSEHMIESAIEALQKTLRQGLRLGGLQPGSMKNARKIPLKKGVPDWTPIDTVILNRLFRLNKEIHSRCGLPEHSALHQVADEMRALDIPWLRAAAQIVPRPAASAKLSPDTSQELQLIYDRSNEARADFRRMAVAMLRMPGRQFEDPLPTNEIGVNDTAAITTTKILQVAWDTGKEGWNRFVGRALVPYTLWLPCTTLNGPFGMACLMLRPEVLQDLREELETWSLLSHAAAGYCFSTDIVYVCRRPLAITFDASDRIHNAEAAAITWKDGYEAYAWKGIFVEKKLIQNRRNLTVNAIKNESNAERRRILIDLYGEARYLMDAGAQLIHEDSCGRLYELKGEGQIALKMVRVRNSTAEPDGSYKEYYLSVPPFVTRAKEAVAWTFNMSESEYHPQVET